MKMPKSTGSKPQGTGGKAAQAKAASAKSEVKATVKDKNLAPGAVPPPSNPAGDGKL